ncbi:MAG: type II toxin-antitoxin system prevent-host-death family antitoxin [Pseudomonadota bacterium]
MGAAKLDDKKVGLLSGPVTVSEFRAKLAEMVARAERGEEVVIARGTEPVAKLVPLKAKRQKRLGILKEMLSTTELEALREAVEKPLSAEDQAALEGELTDELGISKEHWRLEGES